MVLYINWATENRMSTIGDTCLTSESNRPQKARVEFGAIYRAFRWALFGSAYS